MSTKKRFRVYFELASSSGSITVKAGDEDEAHELVAGMCLGDLCEHLNFADREPEIEDVEEVDSKGRSVNLKRYVVRTPDAYWARGMVFEQKQRDAARLTRAEARAKLAEWQAVGWKDMRVMRLVKR